MADNGQIDNVYLNFEVGGNAEEKLDEIDKALEKVEKHAKSSFESIEAAIEKVSTPMGQLEEKIRVSKIRLSELKQQGKENSTAFVSLATSIAKAEQKLEELRLATKQDALKALDWQIPDMSLGDEQRANLERILATAEGGSNAFDGIEQSANKAAVSIDYLMSKKGRLDGLQKELSETYAKLETLTKGGKGYENPEVKKLIGQIDTLQRKIDKLNGSNQNVTKSTNNYNKGLRGLLETAKRFLVFGTFFTIQRQISQAFQEGTQNLYQYSKAIDGKFAQSMDRLSTSFLYLKNAIGAAVPPIINAVTPALESLIDTVAEFGNKLAETFAALTGATTFKKAIKSHKEYAEAVNATNNALAKFDEINNITTSKGDKNQDYGSMFETAQVGMKISNFGVAIGNTLNGIIGGINRKLESVDFRKLAKKLTTGLTDMVETIDFGAVGEMFTTLVLGVFDFADEVVIWLTNGDLQRTIFGALTELINGIGWEELFETITEFILATITRISNFTADTDAWSKLLSAVWKALLGILKGVGKGIWNWLNKTSIWDMIKQVWFLTNPMGATIGNLLFSKIEEGLGEGWQKIKNWLKNHTLVDLIKSIWGGVTDWFGSVFDVSPKNTKKIQGYASGGYVTSGDIFITRENGIPEMVGSIGGRTAVANNDQIVEAISIGVYNAYMDAMSRSGGNKQPTIVQINGREVFRAVQDESTAYSRRTGQPAF